MPAYKKYRKHNKIYNLPKDIRATVDDMLLDTTVNYSQISEWLKKKGQDISRSAVGRYALDTNKLANRLVEAQQQVRELVRLTKDTDGENLTEAGIQFMTHKLTEKIAMADQEIDDMDITDAMRVMADISRTKAYKDKVYAALKSNYEKAYGIFRQQLEAELGKYPDIIERLEKIAEETIGKAIG
ncbi:MAG: DUF3486 family protein [Defluviitaleaceae bacterium]|nr:DUF3486 family protein [Defluviitaleaceae bacterium]